MVISNTFFYSIKLYSNKNKARTQNVSKPNSGRVRQYNTMEKYSTLKYKRVYMKEKKMDILNIYVIEFNGFDTFDNVVKFRHGFDIFLIHFYKFWYIIC